MEPRVVAIVVAREGGEHLARTLRAIAAQTRQPELIILVDNASREELGSQFHTGKASVVRLTHQRAFGECLHEALSTVAAEVDSGLLWLLAQDSDPTPSALDHLVGALEVSPSVAVVGPKQMDWERLDYIQEFGLTTTPWGRTVSLVDDELDQAQHDGMSDVLAVGANGMLVREGVWRELDGFDPGLGVVDDALDFCVRARLAGHRVEVVPSAIVRTAGDGVIGAELTDGFRSIAKRSRQVRAAQLYRRLVYARGIAWLWHWLGLLPNAITRSLGLLLGKRPTAVPAEFAATFQVLFDGLSVSRSRRNLRKHRAMPFSSIDSLRMPFAEVRRRNALTREALRIRAHGHHRPMYFFASGGAWVSLALLIVSAVVMSPLLGAPAMSGGALLPVTADVGALWGQVGFGWRSGALDIAAPADPFAFVVALLGTLTWWNPSFSIVLLWWLALPLAGLGAWIFAARLTDRPVIRAFVAIGYGLAPTLFVALSDGRPAAVITHILLPWLCFAALKALRSWSASATAALLFAAIVACSPSIAPLLILMWIGTLTLTGRYVSRFLAIPLPAVALFAPLVVWQIMRGTPLGLIADPGRATITHAPAHWQLALGFPLEGLGGWLDVTGSGPEKLNAIVVIVVIVLVGILAALALSGLFSPTPIRAQLALGVALVALISAIASSSLSVAFEGSIPVTTWPGASLSVMWLALLVGAAAGMTVLRRYAFYPAVAGITAAVILALPMCIGLVRGTAPIESSNGETLPAYVVARAMTDAQLGTLIITGQPDGGLAVSLDRGRGATLDNSSTALTTATVADASAKTLAELTANLSSLSSSDSKEQLRTFGIGSVLLTPAQVTTEGKLTQLATESTARAMVAFDANPSLESVGKTDFGLLWRFAQPDTAASAQLTSVAGVEPWRAILLSVQLLVLILTLLLAMPTGIPQPDIRPRRSIAGLASETIAFTPKDALAGEDDDED
jgi:GT2 family glycosyltransferase